MLNLMRYLPVIPLEKKKTISKTSSRGRSLSSKELRLSTKKLS